MVICLEQSLGDRRVCVDEVAVAVEVGRTERAVKPTLDILHFLDRTLNLGGDVVVHHRLLILGQSQTEERMVVCLLSGSADQSHRLFRSQRGKSIGGKNVDEGPRWRRRQGGEEGRVGQEIAGRRKREVRVELGGG
jgi:hypothetical protein